MKKIILAAMITLGLAWGTSSAAGPAGAEYSEVMSGRYYLQPKANWLKGMESVEYSQVHWFIVADGLTGGSPASFSDPIKSSDVWNSLRKDVLKRLVSAGYLTEKSLSLSHPKELYKESEWDRAFFQSVVFKHNRFFADYCNAKLIVRSLKLKVSGDLKWWKEETFDLKKGSCQ